MNRICHYLNDKIDQTRKKAMPYKLRDFTKRTRALVLRRGLNLAEENKLQVIEHNDEHAHYRVDNNHGSYYRVEIRLNEKDEVSFTHCECPYRGVGICKHTAAALLDMLRAEGFDFNDLEAEDFIMDDADVLEEDGYEETLRELIREISQNKKFDMMRFLEKQNKEDLMTFIIKYLEESEDIRLVVMAYLWYKNAEVNQHYDKLS